MKERILVTGGAGYLGSIMVPELLRLGYAVTVLDTFKAGQTGLLAHCADPRFTVVRGDCRDRSLLQELLQDIEWIFPLAALVGAPACDADPITAASVNLEAVNLLLTLRSKEQRIVFPTTNSGYGIGAADRFCTEETPLRPISLYGRTKVEAEQAVLNEGNAVTLRLATVFGLSPHMRIDLLVNDFTYRALNDRAVVLFEADAKRNYIHIRDVARAFIHSMEHFEQMSNEPFNVGLSDANLSKKQLCEKIKEQIPSFTYLEAPIGEDPDKRDYIVSNEKIQSTGFQPDTSLERGIEELIKGYTILRNERFSNR